MVQLFLLSNLRHLHFSRAKRAPPWQWEGTAIPVAGQQACEKSLHSEHLLSMVLAFTLLP